MDKPIQILFVGNDPALPAEVHSALSGIPNWRIVPHFAADEYEALEMATSRNPQLICIEMVSDSRRLTSFARELHASLPDTVVVAMYSPLAFGPEQSESSLISKCCAPTCRIS